MKLSGIFDTIKVIVCWLWFLTCQKLVAAFLEEIAKTTSKVYAAHALDKGIIVMTQTKNMEVSTKYCDLGEETVFVAFEAAPVLLVGMHLAGKLVGGRHAEYLKYSSTTIAKCKHKYCDR